MQKKVICQILGLLFISFSVSSQRYLSPVFPSSTSSLDIQYGSNLNYKGNTENLLLDFYEPIGDTLSKRPLLIYVHGGGFTDTNQNKSLNHIVAFADSLARRGYTVASINYRLDTSISNRAVINAMHDTKAAVRFFRANASLYKIDTNLIFMGGESAGAITSLTTTYINTSAEVSFPNTLPLTNDNSVEGNSGHPGFSSEVKATLCFCGGTYTILKEPLFDTAAINSGDQPILLIHSTHDFFIPVSNALEIAQRVTNLGIPNLFYTMPGAGHCPWIYPLPNSWSYLDTLIEYSVPFLYACVQQSTSINNHSKIQNLKIYPNPTADLAIIQIDNSFSQSADLFIRGIIGNLKEKKSVEIVNGTIILDLKNYQNGLYLLELNLTKAKFKGSLLIAH